MIARGVDHAAIIGTGGLANRPLGAGEDFVADGRFVGLAALALGQHRADFSLAAARRIRRRSAAATAPTRPATAALAARRRLPESAAGGLAWAHSSGKSLLGAVAIIAPRKGPGRFRHSTWNPSPAASVAAQAVSLQRLPSAKPNAGNLLAFFREYAIISVASYPEAVPCLSREKRDEDSRAVRRRIGVCSVGVSPCRRRRDRAGGRFSLGKEKGRRQGEVSRFRLQAEVRVAVQVGLQQRRRQGFQQGRRQGTGQGRPEGKEEVVRRCRRFLLIAARGEKRIRKAPTITSTPRTPKSG